MGRLAGFKYRDVIAKLRRLGFEFERHGAGSHEFWRQRDTDARVLIANHRGDLPEGTLRAMLRDGDIDVDAFLAD